MTTYPATAAPEIAYANPAPRVLVLDDNTMLTQMLGSMLDIYGYQAATANAGEEALELLAFEHFDVVVSDLRMPGMDGQEFYRRAVAAHPELARRVVFLTGFSVGPGARQFIEATACPLLTKPCSLQNVQEIIADLLQAEPVAA